MKERTTNEVEGIEKGWTTSGLVGHGHDFSPCPQSKMEATEAH